MIGNFGIDLKTHLNLLKGNKFILRNGLSLLLLHFQTKLNGFIYSFIKRREGLRLSVAPWKIGNGSKIHSVFVLSNNDLELIVFHEIFESKSILIQQKHFEKKKEIVVETRLIASLQFYIHS